MGISRKSIPILDNLGISAQQVQDEFKKTGDFAEAVGNIINESMGEAGETILTTAERQAQLRTEIENTKVEIGERLLPVINSLLTGLLDVANAFDKAFQGREGRLSDITDKIAESGMSVEELNSQLAKNRAEIDDILKRYPNVEKVNRTVLALMDAGAAKERDRLDSLKLQNQAIEQYVKFLSAKKTTQAEDTEEIEKSTKAIDKQTDAVWGLGQALLALGQTMAANLQSERGVEVFGIDTEKTAEEIIKIKEQLDGLMRLTPALQPPPSDEFDLDEFTENWQMYAMEVMGIMDTINGYFIQGENYKLEVLQNRLEKGYISEKQYEDQEKEIRRRQAQREKLFSIFAVLANTPSSILKAAALGGPPLAALATVQAVAQLFAASALQIPAFKEGVIDLKGKGTETSDSNLAWLSKGESVITAKATKRHKDALDAIQKDKFDDYVMKVYLKQLQDKQKDTAISWDDYRLLLATQRSISQSVENTNKIVSAIKDNRPHRF